MLGCKERDFRFFGWLAQFVGFTIAGFGLVIDAKQDGRFAPINWWNRRPSIYTRTIHVYATEMVEADDFMTGYVWTSAPPNAPIDEQIQSLRRNVEGLHSRVSTTADDIQFLRTETKEMFVHLSNNVAETKAGLSKQVVGIRSGKVHVNFFGVFLFIIGTFVATFSPEFGSFLHDSTPCPPLFSQN